MATPASAIRTTLRSGQALGLLVLLTPCCVAEAHAANATPDRMAARAPAMVTLPAESASDFPDGRFLSSQRIGLLSIEAGPLRHPEWPEERAFPVEGRADINGDGYPDIVVGAPYDSTRNGETGAVLVYFGGPQMDDRADVVLAGPPTSERFGQSVSSAGDFNGDGFDDLVVGAPRRIVDWGTMPPGEAFIYFGGPGFGDAPYIRLSEYLANDHFGTSVAGIGDVNADGLADVIVGAPGHRNNWAGTGRAFVYFGGPPAGQHRGFALAGEYAWDRFGQSVSGAGDVNGDGEDDLIVGAPYNDANGQLSGRVYVYHGGHGFDAVPDAVLTGAAGQRWGATVGAAGDVNGDGRGDVLVVAWESQNTLIFHGSPIMTGVPDAVLSGGARSISRGSVALGDINDDGFDDVAVGQPDSSRVQVFLGGVSMDEQPDLLIVGRLPLVFGPAVSGARDVDGDGSPELVVASHDWGEPAVAQVLRLVGARYKVVRPNAREQWAGVTTETVTWMGRGLADVELSTDDGLTWSALATEVGGDDINSVAVQVPNLTTTLARIRVIASGEPPAATNRDESDGTFTIVRRYPIVVSPDGTGDVTSIQEGMELTNAIRLAGLIQPELVVMPGFYDEVLTARCDLSPMRIVCPDGPLRTRVRAVAFEACDWNLGDGYEFTGLGIVDRVHASAYGVGMTWRNCRFENGYTSRVMGDWANVVGCEFNADSELLGYIGTFDSLIVRGARLRLTSDPIGGVAICNSTFEGPGDTALVVASHGDAYVAISNCTFDGFDYGVVAEPMYYDSECIWIFRCQFRVNRIGASFSYDKRPDWGNPYSGGLCLSVGETIFHGGQTAIHWTDGSAGVYLRNVTVDHPSGDAIVAGLGRMAAIESVTVVGAGGRGLVLRPANDLPWTGVFGNRILDSGGDGIAVEDPDGRLLGLKIIGNLVSGSGGAGLRFASTAWNRSGFGSAHVQVSGNTLVLNDGDGMHLKTADSLLVSPRNNVIAGNEGVGLQTKGVAAHLVSRNDLWSNRDGDHAGDPIGDSNLFVDPGFCDPLVGDWRVQSGSPCAPDGASGRIGAFDVGCAASRIEASVANGNKSNVESNAKVKLEVYGHRLLDPGRIDPTTARLGEARPESWAIGDLNEDGFPDLRLSYRARDIAPDGLVTDSLFAATAVPATHVYARIELSSRGRAASVAGATSRPERLAIESIRAIGGGRVEAVISTYSGEGASLELFDVAGRRLAREHLEAQDASHSMRLSLGSRLETGLYFIRLTQRGEQVVRKVAVLW